MCHLAFNHIREDNSWTTAKITTKNEDSFVSVYYLPSLVHV